MPSRKNWFSGSLLAGIVVMTASAQAQQIAFTWDDLPAHSALPPGETRIEIGRKLIAAMKEAGVPPVYGFVNGIRTEEQPLSTPMLKEWRDAGFLLGNHTWSHMNLNQHSLEEWKADLLKNEPLLKVYMGTGDWQWVRFPNLGEGDTSEKRKGVRRFLAGQGYTIAGVTMSFGDYLFNDPYARCVAKNDNTAISQLEASYLATAEATIDYDREMSGALYGRDIPYVLLMHVGGLDARMLPRLLKLYRDKGFSFIRLEDAVKDPFYKNDLDLALSPMPDTLEEAMTLRGLPVPTRPKPSMDLNAVCRSK
jgi:peptidoglycan/xylan/chitin deacetylase (PgdA/CDA1 family)